MSTISRRFPVLVLAAVAAVAATAVGASALTTAPLRPGEPAPDGVSEVVSVGLGRSEPVRIVIPSIDVDAAVVPLGLDGGELAAPPDARRAGWYAQGTSPGELGSAVILGRAAPAQRGAGAVFTRLDRVAAGDRVEVVREDGTVASFVVERVEERGDACEPRRRDCAAEAAPHDTGAEAQLRLVSRKVVVWATLAP